MNNKLVLYGAGRFGVFAALVLSARGCAPCCFCDKNISDGVEPITGLPIISPEKLKSGYSDAQIIITAFTQKVIDTIWADLNAAGIDKSRVSQFYSLQDACLQNKELINYIARHGFRFQSITTLSSILKDRLQITDEIIKVDDIYFYYDIRAPGSFKIIADVFLCYFAGLPHTRENVGIIESICGNHAYLLDDENTPMMINPNDVVIDAGALYGEFSLLAAKVFNAEVYAFEPSSSNYEKLLKTIALNDCGDRIHAVMAGLGNCSAQLRFLNNLTNSAGSKISNQGDELVSVTTVDGFVAENNLSRVDFIKADIEGYEREMLKGAVKTLRELAPKLSLCTYHLNDDPVMLRALISKANPAYKFEQRRNILFAWVDK